MLLDRITRNDREAWENALGTADLLGNLVAQTPDPAARRTGCPHRSLAERNGPADARICRIECVIGMHIYVLD